MYEELAYKEIAQLIDKSESSVRNYKQNQPKLLEILKLGAYCIKHGISIEKLKKFKELEQIIKEDK